MTLREQYFLPQTIENKVDKFLEKYGNEDSKRNIAHKPQESTLLILDMMDYFLSPDSNAFIPSAQFILPQIHRLIACFQQLNRPIILTRHVNTENDAGMLKSWWRKVITANDPESNIIKELAEYDLPVIEKSQYDAFYGTNLKEMLIESNSSQVIITGVMTHICCETTARSAFMNGFLVLFPVDGTATYNEDFHSATLLNLSHGFAVVTSVDKLLKKYGQNEIS